MLSGHLVLLLATTLLNWEESTQTASNDGDSWCEGVAPQLKELSESWEDTYWEMSGEFTQWNTGKVDVVRTTTPYWSSYSSAGLGFRLGVGGSSQDAHAMLLLSNPQTEFRRISRSQGTSVYARRAYIDRDEVVVKNMMPALSWFLFQDVDLLRLESKSVTLESDVPVEVRRYPGIPWDRRLGHSVFLSFSTPSAPTAKYFAEIVIVGPHLGSWVAFRNTGSEYGRPIIAVTGRSNTELPQRHFHKAVPVPGGELISEWLVSLERVNLESRALIQNWAGADTVPFLEGDSENPRPGVISEGFLHLYSGVHRGPLTATEDSALGVILMLIGAGLLITVIAIRHKHNLLTGSNHENTTN